MIYTVTFNPAIDYVMRVDQLQLGETNRSDCERLSVGGKGINVSVVLGRLGLESTALGFIGGFTGAAVEQELARQGVHTDLIRLPQGLTRINVKLKTDRETEINAQGPSIPEEALGQLFERLERLGREDTLVLAGSVPGSVVQDIYRRILETLDGRGIRFVVDATRELLLEVLPYHPFLIKPNQQELGELFGRELTDGRDVALYARKLQEMGAQNVLVSRGGKGALLVTAEGEVLTAPAAVGTVRNTVGAGDSMVAGFLFGWFRRGDYRYALRCGIAAGGATAFSDELASREDFLSLLNGPV